MGARSNIKIKETYRSRRYSLEEPQPFAQCLWFVIQVFQDLILKTLRLFQVTVGAQQFASPLFESGIIRQR